MYLLKKLTEIPRRLWAFLLFVFSLKTPTERHRQWLVPIMLLLSCLQWQKADAIEYDCEKFRDEQNRFTVETSPNGYVHIKILCYWEDCILSTGDSRLGDITISYGGHNIFTATYDKANYKITKLSGGVLYQGGPCGSGNLVSDGSSFGLPANGTRYIDLYFYPTTYTSPIMVASGTWYYSYLGENANQILPIRRDLTWSIPEIEAISLDSFKLDLGAKKTILYGTRKRNATNPNDMGGAEDYSLIVDGNVGNRYSWIEGIPGTANFKYKYEVDKIGVESATYSSKYSHKSACNKGGHVFEKISEKIKVPAFIYPVYASAVFNSEEKVVNISWNTPTVSGVSGTDYLNSGYIVKRRSVNSSEWQVIGETKTAKENTFEDKSFVDENDINDSYIYRIESAYAKQLNYKGDNYTAESKPVKVSTSHMNVYNLVVAVDTVKEMVSLNWNVSGISWATGSSLIITRMNASTKKTETLATLGDSNKVVTNNTNGVLSGSYVDDAVALCSLYVYKVYVDAGKAYGDLGSLTSDTILLSEIGTMKSLQCSKGYYPDRTEVNWTAAGYFNMFVVERKLESELDSKYKQIATISANRSQQNYSYEDNTCIPGVLYTYRVYGKDDCGNKTISSNKLSEPGFRTPTGDFYGRVTYENGQSVDSVEVFLSTEEEVSAQSLLLNKTGISTVIPQLEGSTDLTFQAWMTLDSTTQSTITLGDYSIAFSKGGKVELADNKGSASFQLTGLDNSYRHISAVFASNRLALYMNGKLVSSEKTTDTISNNSGTCLIGDNYVGNIDEVRIWTKALSESEISNDYTRYIVGNEKSLVCYYTFNFVANGMCFDMSQNGYEYNGNDGKLGSGISASKMVPSESQLAYKGVTDASGTYSIRAVPYYSNGTAYTLTPRRGTHQFSATQEIRLISASVPSHTVNFTDNSSFPVSGVVRFSGGEFPVEGVSFTIDGVPALSKTGELIVTDANGAFTINVPVGIHEVKAVKEGHTFELDGRICDSHGNDRNYQDIQVDVELYDNTKVKYIGRVCGGSVQEEKPVGFSLSKNNLADNMKIVLTPTVDNYALQLAENVHNDTTAHFIRSGILANNKAAKAKTTITEFNQNDVTINVNNETGEFVAWVYPIKYKVALSVYGHDGINGNNSVLDLSNYSISQYETYEYKDTVFANGIDTLKGYEIKSFSDSVEYRQKQVFTKYYRAQMEVAQLSKQGAVLDYFGKKSQNFTTVGGETTNAVLYDDKSKSYTFGLPTFISQETYAFQYAIFEEYPYYVDSKNIDKDKTDRVVIEDATVAFNNRLAVSDSLSEDGNIYMFTVGEPDMTTAIGSIGATFTYGDSDNPTSVAWVNPLGNENGEAYVLGSHLTGVDFVTAGPDHFLAVLRDPPGSTSYSYLEKGVSFTEETTYTGSLSNEGSEDFKEGYVKKNCQFSAVDAAGAITGTTTFEFETATGYTVGVEHSENYTGSNTKSTNITTTTRFQTSDDPIYDGANGDVYIGYSTNLSFGSNFSMTVVSRSEYDEAGEDAYEATIKLTDKYALVKQKGVSIGSNFKTLFAYPQIHIEQVLIPNIESLRNSLLVLPHEVGDTTAWKTLANANNTPYYLSKVVKDDETFGTAGSYEVIYPTNVTKVDTIAYLNQAIASWNKAMSDNDSVKANASKLLQNYSFQAGANIEYSESYSTTISSSHGFEVTVGGKFANDMKATIFGAEMMFSLEEKLATTQGREWNDELEMSHAKGFVLAEDGDDDYLSVDVFYENDKRDETYSTNSDWTTIDYGAGSVNENSLNDKDNFSMFIFKTRGGATSCPYEDAYKAVHWKGHEDQLLSAATMKLEEPSIEIANYHIENVPSGEEAYLTVYMKNNSETGEDQWFDLRMVDASNPYGAVPSIDGNSMSGFALEYLVPAGDVLEKTLTITKGSALKYDNLAIVLASKCQADPTGFLDVIADTAYFDVHFIPTCTDVAISYPTNNWTYNTNCATDTIDGLVKHYMPITISGFDVNYSDFEHIELQYKSSSASDDDWISLAYYYQNDSLAKVAVKNGFNAFTISADDGGSIKYKFYMDDLPDQKYDLRAVSFCNINNEMYDNPSVVISGIKDMYNPRLFGAPKPANGVLTVEDDGRIDFNETIAEGMLTINNFEVTGIRNGAVTSHDVAIALDGKNDYLTTEVTRNLANKDLTFECWVNFDSLQNATFFSHGNAGESIEMGMNESGKVVVMVGDKNIVSEMPASWEKSSWNHVALVYNSEESNATAYVNYLSVIDAVSVPAYAGNGTVEVGRSASKKSGYFNGKVDQFRIWNEVRSRSTIQANSAVKLSGNDLNLMAYYEMDEAKGSVTEDKARGANLVMKGGSWSLPEGRSASFGGNSYVAMDASAAVVTSDMDFTLEFWFNAPSEAKNQTILSTGDGVSSLGENPASVFSVGFDANSQLTFRHNGQEIAVNGKYADDNWHNFTLAVNRSSGIARIYMDGALNTYFDAEKIGRLSADKLYAGARVWHPEASIVDSVDHYFTGKVDEIRLWKLYRQQSQVESFYNQKVEGNEMGLMLYYPFEHYVMWQGTPEMQFTLENKANNSVGASVAVGDVKEVTNIPPVKSKGAVSSLLYDWVVNDDALIITLREQDYRIEKSIVNFTVNKVQDVNGNYIVSPITWSAYIDRNQLKWMDDAVTINKKAGDPYKFEAQVVNNGGSIINYDLNNMPSWLSASVESGVINPLQKQTIEFEIDPSLAVGSYDEVVYLTNSNNVTEPLKLNVTVEGDTPDWSVDPSKYQFNMIVYGQLKIDGAFSNDKNDMLAAFYNGECVGVANMSYNKTMDMWYAMMTVYSGTSDSHKLEYRMWDASTGRMLSAVADSADFVDNKVLGTPTKPVVFSNGTVKYQNIQLNKGWNWVTFNLANTGMTDLKSYLGSATWSKNSIIKDLNGHASYSEAKVKWTASQSPNYTFALSNNSMFKVYSEIDQTLSVSGADIDLSATLISIEPAAWTYLPYLPNRSMTVKAALAGLEAKEGDVIKSNDGFAMYYGNEWIGSLVSMQPNAGYMYKSGSAVAKTFKYPTSATTLRSYSAVEPKASTYESSMNIVAYAPEKAEGDVVRAYVSGAENEVVEVALTDDYALQFINVSAKEGDAVRFTLERNGVTYEATNQMLFASDKVYGTPNTPVVLNFNVDGAKEALVAYPNPVVDVLNITGVLAEGEATIELVDVVGRVVYTANVTASGNSFEESINMSGLASGSYVLKVTQNDEVKTLKIVKK